MKFKYFKFKRNIIFGFIFLFSLVIASNTHGQTPIDWKKDLDYLQNYMEIMHPRLFSFIAEGDFNESITEIKADLPYLKDSEVITRIVKLMVSIQDGHTGVAFHVSNNYITSLFKYYPVWLYRFKDGYYVLYATSRYSELVGKEVIRIGELPVDEAMCRINVFISADNDFGKARYIPLIHEFLLYNQLTCDSSLLKLSVIGKDSIVEEVYIESDSLSNFYIPKKIFPRSNSIITSMEYPESKTPLYLSHLDYGGYTGENYWFSNQLEDSLVYLQINANSNIDGYPFEDLCDKLFNTIDSTFATRLVIDVRLNSGGSHFEHPLLEGIIQRPHINCPEKLFIVIGRNTFSAAQHLVNQIERYTNATIIGEPTGARPNMLGSITRFTLPSSGLKCFTAKEYIQDSDYFDSRLCTRPHYYKELSSEDYLLGNDPALTAVLNFELLRTVTEQLQQEFISSYNEGGIQGFISIYNKRKHLMSENGINKEWFLMDEFSHLIYSNRKSNEDYGTYKKFVVSELPLSVRANYWYGRHCHLDGKINDAQYYFHKCLMINPDHSYAKKYLSLIKLNEKNTR